MIGDLLGAMVSWRTFLLALLVFGFAPGALLRVIVRAFGRDDSRRRELLAELHAVPRLERPFWVFEQLEVALFEGIWPRFAKWAKSRPPAVFARRTGLALGVGSTYYLLLAVACALLVVGLVMVLSASSGAALAKQGDSYTYFKRQLMWVVGGVVVMLVVSRIDYRVWRRLGTPLLVVATAGLVYVLIHPGAVSAYGSTRWISMPGGFTVQPAEFAKLALLLFSAHVLARKARLLRDVHHLLVPVLPLTMLLAALVMLEPNLGTTMLLCAIAFGILFVAGTPLRLLSGIGSLGLAVGVGIVMFNSATYRRIQFLSFLDPAPDPMNSGYQFIQARLALDSGGLLGVGLGAGRQKSYVPNAHTDFIFAIIGEELGLVGTLSILLLFVALATPGSGSLSGPPTRSAATWPVG
jgi:cell division protein FtsW